MTFPKNENSFSPIFRQTIMAASVRQVTVLYDTEPQARSMAATMRAYVGKLYKAAEKNPELDELVKAAQACMFRIEGKMFIAQPRDMDTRFDRLKAALKVDAVPSMGDDVEASLAALKEKIGPEVKLVKNPYF